MEKLSDLIKQSNLNLVAICVGVVISIAEELGNSNLIVARRLFKEHGIKLSHSTICSLLKRHKISKKYRTADYH